MLEVDENKQPSQAEPEQESKVDPGEKPPDVEQKVEDSQDTNASAAPAPAQQAEETNADRDANAAPVELPVANTDNSNSNNSAVAEASQEPKSPMREGLSDSEEEGGANGTHPSSGPDLPPVRVRVRRTINAAILALRMLKQEPHVMSEASKAAIEAAATTPPTVRLWLQTAYFLVRSFVHSFVCLFCLYDVFAFAAVKRFGDCCMTSGGGIDICIRIGTGIGIGTHGSTEERHTLHVLVLVLVLSSFDLVG